MLKIQRITLDQLGVHQGVKKVSEPRLCNKMKFSLKTKGQRNCIKVVSNGDDSYLIVDGVKRLIAAKELNKENPEEFNELNCEIIDLSENVEIVDDHIINNTNTKRTWTEIYNQLNHILYPLGRQRGKKRTEWDEVEFPEGVKKDRMEWATIQIDCDYGSKTLRNVMTIFEDETYLPEQVKLDLIDELDKGEVSPHGAYKVYEMYKLSHSKEQAKQRVLGGLINTQTRRYKLFNKSSLDLSDLEDESIDMAIQSPPYFNQREYPNQDEMKHGKEKTSSEYIENLVKFNGGIKTKLKPGGVNVIIIGESYLGGYNAICPRLMTALIEDGWIGVDMNILAKENPVPQKLENRFQPAYEVAIVVSKPGGEMTFNLVEDEEDNSDKVTGLKKSKRKKNGQCKYYKGNDVKHLTNVIKTPAFNKNEFKMIDPDFRHDAPACTKTYEKFIKAYSNPGDTLLDAFVGSGTVGIGLTMGRNVVGYDVDPASIEFSSKRFNYFLNEENNQTELNIAA